MILFLIGLLCGVMSSLGLGGGTLLVPMLIYFLGYPFKVSALLNLLSFLIMSIIISPIYNCKKLLNVFDGLFVAFVGVVGTIASSLFVNKIGDEYGKKIFAIFVFVVAMIQFALLLKKIKLKTYR